MADGKFVAYYRVSTQKQGASGLGLEAQRQAVTSYLNGNGFELMGEFTEVESGRRKARPELAKALAACKKHKAVLVIAKLDRLARNVHFVTGLMESGVDFRCTDMPEANKTMLQLWAVMAEWEREQISRRTAAALAAAKARGVELGKHAKVLAPQNAAKADTFARSLAGRVHELKARGIGTVRALTDELNRQAVPTMRGERWHVSTTHRLLKRLERLEGQEAA